MNIAQLSLIAALAFVLEAVGMRFRGLRLPASRWSRNISGATFVALFGAALQIGAFLWGQHRIDEAAAYDRQNGFPPTPPDIWILGLYGLLLLGTAGFCFVQLALYLRQQRREERSVSAPRDA